MPTPKVPKPPVYQISIKARVPASKMWKRDFAENRSRVVAAFQPDAAFFDGMRALLELLTLTDPNVIMGLMLNLMGSWPDDARVNMVLGLAKGLGMTMATEGDTPTFKVEQRFNPLPVQRPDGTIERRSASGLILPDGPLVTPGA